MTNQFGSFVNQILSNCTSVEPDVGMGATILMHSDRHACTIVEVTKNKKGEIERICLQRDKAIRTDSNGMSEAQEYKFDVDPLGSKTWFSKNRKGEWVAVYYSETTRRWKKTISGRGVFIGKREEYYDYTF